MAKQEIEVAGAKRQIKITPYEHHTKYHETDQQGIIHTSNYLNWMEDARMSLMEQMGLSFKQMLDMEITSPTISHSIEYRSAVKFDETVVVETKLLSYDGHEMEIAYRIYDKATGEDRAIGKTLHCFLNNSGAPIPMNHVYPELETKFFDFK